MTTAKSFGNLIDGEWVPSKSGRTFADHSPSDTRQIVASFPDSGPEDIAASVEAAERAFRSWRLVPAPKRGEIVFRMGEILARRKEELARAMAQEMGKPLREARGDVQEGIDVCFHIGGEGRRLHGFTTPSELPDKTCFTTRQPVKSRQSGRYIAAPGLTHHQSALVQCSVFSGDFSLEACVGIV